MGSAKPRGSLSPFLPSPGTPGPGERWPCRWSCKCYEALLHAWVGAEPGRKERPWLPPLPCTLETVAHPSPQGPPLSLEVNSSLCPARLGRPAQTRD